MNGSNCFIRDEYIVKHYCGPLYKVVNLNACPAPGTEIKRSKKGSVNSSKLQHNVVRAKTAIAELAICNEWDYWCTFTVDPRKYDRYCLKKYQAAFAEFIHNYNKRLPDMYKVRYLLVPEMHQDSAWHFHGFLKGINPEDLCMNSNGYLEWAQYRKQFGYMSIEPIKDIAKASAYLTKYMEKGVSNTAIELGAHLYYASKGLRRAETVYRGPARLNAEWDYINDYCRIKWLKNDDELKLIEVYGNGF